jgi:hypothetical protein
MNYLKLAAMGLIIILVLNIILFVLDIIGQLIFWTVIIAVALIAYKVIPKWREKLK